ncbi:hypothetical protein EJB05_21592, partial [Eragrostis curvula]
MDAWRAEGHAANSVIYLPPHDKWRAMRRFAATELFAKGRLDARQPLRQEKVQEMVGHISEHAARGEPVDVGHAAFVTALDLLSRTLYSIDLGTEDVRHMHGEGSLGAGRDTNNFGRCSSLGSRRSTRRATQVGCIDQIINGQFAGRRCGRDAGEPRKNDMMDVVLDKEQEWKERGSPMNYDAVKGMFTEFFVAGTETTSSTVEWAMAELLRHPESMKKVKEELKTVISTKTVMEESDINKLPYLQAVFMPERFIANDISFWSKDFELIPFGAGRRMCLGLPLAHRMVHLMLGSLLHNFNWTLPPDIEENGIDMTEIFGAVVSMATPLKAIAYKCGE